MKKKKRLLYVFTGLIVILILAIVSVFAFINPIAKNVIEKVGPVQTGVDVTLESINISPFKGRVEIRNLIVGNPEGYTSDHAVKLGFVNAELNIPSVFSDKLIIHEVTLKDVNVNYETKMFTSNIQQIIDNASQLSSSGNVPESDTKEKAEKKNKQEKKLQVDLFELENVGVNVVINGVKKSHDAGVFVTVKPLRDLGKDEDGITASELVVTVLSIILTDSAEQGILSINESVSKAVKSIDSEIKDLIKKSDDKWQEISKSANELTDGLRDLFSGKKNDSNDK